MSAKVERSDYYVELGIERTAQSEEIKQAYRNLALKWIPSKNQDNLQEAEKKFRQVSEAYSVLIDPAKRELYDQNGPTDFKFNLEDFLVSNTFDSLFPAEELQTFKRLTIKPTADEERKTSKAQPTAEEKKIAEKKTLDKLPKVAANQKSIPKAEEENWDDDFGEDEDFDYNPEDDDDDYGLDEGNLGEEDEEAAARREARQMYGEEDEEDFQVFDQFMDEAERKYILPLFIEENTKKVADNRLECKICTKTFDEPVIEEHIISEHNKELKKWTDKAIDEDYESDIKRLSKAPVFMPKKV